jgi:SAM-dependent methyltransferase
MSNDKPWYDREEFWAATGPIMFRQARWDKAFEEVDAIISLLGLAEGSSILDLCCGPGRHSLELARRGFNVTGVDRTSDYIDEARSRAEKEGLDVEFVVGDMREFVREAAFDAVINVFTSFGYFEDPEEDRQIALNMRSCLRPGGALFLDAMGKEVLARIFQERDWVRIDDTIMLEERELSKNWGWIKSRWILIKDGKMEEHVLELRPYSAVELSGLLVNCGFDAVEFYGDLAGAPYDQNAKRLIAIARTGLV